MNSPDISDIATVCHGLDNADYHAADAYSNSKLTLAARSKAHLLHAIEHPEQRVETPAMKMGTAVHCAVLEPDEFLKRYECEPDDLNRRTKEGRAFISDKLDAGIIVLKRDEFEGCLKIRDKVHAHPVVGSPLKNGLGVAELSLFDTCPSTGLKIKCRPDYLIQDLGIIFDLKTTVSAEPRAFANSCAKYRYHVQEAFYRYVYWCALDAKVNDFLFIAVEKSAPYEMAVFDLDEAAKLEGERLVQLELEAIAQCVESGEWPGYGDGIIELTLPCWAIDQTESLFFDDDSVGVVDHDNV